MTEFKLHFYLKHKKEKNNTALIMGRIKIGQSVTLFNTQLDIQVSLWNNKLGRATGKSKSAIFINTVLEEYNISIYSIYKRLVEEKDNLSAQDIKNTYFSSSFGQTLLIQYYELHNNKFLLKVDINRKMVTYKHYCTHLKHLTNFIHQKYNINDIPFRSLPSSFIEAYDYYLRVDLKFESSTIVNIIGRLHHVIKAAINDGHLRHDPFINYRYIIEPSTPKSITEKELKKIINTPLKKSNQNLVRDMFLFSCFTGISFSDMRNLTNNNLIKEEDGTWWIHSVRQKTNTPFNIPLMTQPLQLIEKYYNSTKDRSLFPMLSCSKTNINLKKIAKQCNIDKKLTFHMARHTFATTITS